MNHQVDYFNKLYGAEVSALKISKTGSREWNNAYRAILEALLQQPLIQRDDKFFVEEWLYDYRLEDGDTGDTFFTLFEKCIQSVKAQKELL